MSTPPSIQFICASSSNTVGTVTAYNDGVINVPTINISDPQPVKTACQQILRQVGLVGGVYAARPYKLAVIKNGVTLFTVRSIWWGSQQNIDEAATNVQLVDNQWLDLTQKPV